jgi:hypothetical protein
VYNRPGAADSGVHDHGIRCGPHESDATCFAAKQIWHVLESGGLAIPIGAELHGIRLDLEVTTTKNANLKSADASGWTLPDYERRARFRFHSHVPTR